MNILANIGETMISIEDIVFTIGVSIVYLSIIPFQLLLFPMNYYSVKDVIYSGKFKNAVGALASRFALITLICWILWMLKKPCFIAIWGITIGSFLCAWPSIYHYQLFCFIKNRYKFLYFLACIVSILFSCGCAIFVQKILLPMIIEGKSFYLIDNNGIKLLFSILSILSPIGIRKMIQEEEQDNPYLVSDTFCADLYFSIRKIQFNKRFFDQYKYEIEKAAKDHNLSSALLMIVIKLEKINRGSWLFCLAEQLAVRFFPGLLIHLDASLGLAQIKISKAQGRFHMAPQKYIRDMLKTDVSIDLCGYVLQDILKEYESFMPSDKDPFFDVYVGDNDISENYKRSLYIASKYVCGEKNVMKKYVLVYAQLIFAEAYQSDSENG